MRIAVISDIHGNWHGLEAVLADIEREQVDEIWCLGDVVGYGPQPNRCVKEVRAHAAVCLMGNHDLAALGRVELTDFSPDAAVSATWTAAELDPEAHDFLAGLGPKAPRQGAEPFPRGPPDPL